MDQFMNDSGWKFTPPPFTTHQKYSAKNSTVVFTQTDYSSSIYSISTSPFFLDICDDLNNSNPFDK